MGLKVLTRFYAVGYREFKKKKEFSMDFFFPIQELFTLKKIFKKSILNNQSKDLVKF